MVSKPLDVGLSPRLRGNPNSTPLTGTSTGSIPAPAGEPSPECVAGYRWAVYPRACGGTTNAASTFSMSIGLSPRLRGNPLLFSCCRIVPGSIPAPAGEPFARTSPGDMPRVYPRACGGTDDGRRFLGWIVGLSPRLRGNQRCDRSKITTKRSIPAPAGEPTSASIFDCGTGVYPRACGGTARRIVTSRGPTGLSPRLRGNLTWRKVPGLCRRSIPAPAGEPACMPCNLIPNSVYPRACGGTPLAA